MSGEGSKPAGVVKTMLTEDEDNRVWDPVRVMAWGGVVMFMVLTVFTVVWQGHEFRYLEFGAGLGAILTALGTANYLNAKGK
jgi:hypothetical protein